MFTNSNPIHGKTHFSLQQEIPLLVGSVAVAAVGSLGLSIVTSISISPMQFLGVGACIYLASKVGQIGYQKFYGPYGNARSSRSARRAGSEISLGNMHNAVSAVKTISGTDRPTRSPRRARSEASLAMLQGAVTKARASLKKEEAIYLAAKARGEQGSPEDRALVRRYESREATVSVSALLLAVSRRRTSSTASSSGDA